MGENKFDVSWKNLWKVFAITFVITILYPFTLIEKIISRKIVKNVKLKYPPIFILGHWRSGTTYLHEMLNSDPNLEHMTLTESVFPNLFLFFYGFIKKIFSLFLPETRPQDDMKISTEMSNEHDFAIANISSMSPYSGAYFPKNQDFYNRYVSLEGVSEKEVQKLKESFDYVVKKLTIRKKFKQLVLKSPIDTGRVNLLIDLYPDAKFIHIKRNPYHVFYSTLRMYEKLVTIMMLQDIHPDLEEFVLKTYADLMGKYYDDLHLIPEENRYEISYEEFFKDPMGNIEKVYAKLHISDFENAKPGLQAYVDKNKNYKPSTYNIPTKEKEKIYTRWKRIFSNMKYDLPTT